MSEAFEELVADNNPQTSIDWRAVSIDLRRALENRNAEIARLRAELSTALGKNIAFADELKSLRHDLATARIIAQRDAVEITRLTVDVRRIIDATWGYALQDGSVPGAAIQYKIITALAPRPPEGKGE